VTMIDNGQNGNFECTKRRPKHWSAWEATRLVHVQTMANKG
jgi:hypothetical protein